MTIKKFFILLCSMLMLWNVLVFAYDITEKEKQSYCSGTRYAPEQKDIEVRNGIVTIYSRKNATMLGYDIVPQLSISLKESEKGILKDGDILYFEISKEANRYVESKNLHIETKGLIAKEVLTEKKQNQFAVAISRSDENEKGFIRIYFDAEVKGISNNEKENLPVFSLWLNTDSSKQNNLFSNENRENILLIDDFLEVWSTEKSEQVIQENRQRVLEIQLPSMIFYVGESNMKWWDSIKQLTQPVYINSSGVAMLCFDDFINISKQLEDIGVIVEQRNKQYDITAGKNQYVIDIENCCIQKQQGEIIQNALEQKEGVYYISLREMARLFGKGEDIYWHRWDKTIHIK